MHRRRIARLAARTHVRHAVTAAALTAALATSTAAFADKTDIVLFKNGDRLTGELKTLDRGKISLDTDATGVIKIEWDDIEQIYSSTTFEVALDNGERLYGSLAETTRHNEIRLQTEATALDLPIATVVRMTPIKSTIIDRMSMNVDVGYSIAKANKLEQSNLSYDFAYREEKRQITFGLDSSTSNSESDPSSTRMFTNLTYRRFLQARSWDPFGIAQFERNDELGIDRRESVGGGMSRWIRDTSQNRITFNGGLIRSLEDDHLSTETKSDTEALVAMDFEWFRYDTPQLDVSTKFSVYNRLSGTREPRGNLDVNFKWEIFKDFYWSFSFYYTFDKQTETGEPTDDYGSFVSLGWKL
ncbi:MAG TPA: DUF481 domain-containing protein [Gammaproteobacteria bacterium]|nr:DUF481 domain-containing protein [Gammaproteobacteria bacterium]